MKRRIAIAARALALAALAVHTITGAALAAPTHITNCTIISSPGSYVLDNDLVACGDPAISIAANNVSLNLGGHKIVGPGTIGILGVGVSNVRVTNGSIEGWIAGASLLGAWACAFERVTFKNNTAGIFVVGDYGNVLRCTFSGHEVAIGLVGDKHDACYNNISVEGAAVGIAGVGSSGRVVCNRVTGRGGKSLAMDKTSLFEILNRLRQMGRLPKSDALFRGFDRLGLFGGNDNVAADVECVNVGGIGWVGFDTVFQSNVCTMTGASGIVVTGDRNVLSRNQCNSNAQDGIAICAGSGNRISANSAAKNGNVDLRDDNLPNCINAWTNNFFGTDNEGNGPHVGCIQ